MKKAILLLTVILMTLLWGCQGGGFDPKRVSEAYGGAGEISAQMDIRTCYDVIIDYTLSYKRTGGVAQVTILTPEALSGVTAHLGEGECTLVYDGTSVETLLPAIPGFSPADAMHGLVEDLINAVPVNYTVEKIGDLRQGALTYSSAYGDYDCEKRVWLDAESLAITRCEYLLDGRLMMTMDVNMLGLY